MGQLSFSLEHSDQICGHYGDLRDDGSQRHRGFWLAAVRCGDAGDALQSPWLKLSWPGVGPWDWEMSA